MAPDSVSVFIDSCSHTLTFFDECAGEEVCGGCGVVLNQKIEEMTIGPSPVRRVSPLRMCDDGLPTTLNPAVFSRRLSMMSNPTNGANNKVKNLQKAMSVLESVAGQLHLTEPVKDRAAYIYRKAYNAGLTRGRSISGIMGASIHIAARESGSPLAVKDVQALITEQRADVADSYRLLLRTLDLTIPVQENNLFVRKFAQECNLSEKTVRRAAEILENAKTDRVFEGKAGNTMAAGALYIAALENGERMTQHIMSMVSGLTTVTIRRRFHELTSALGIELVFPQKLAMEQKVQEQRVLTSPIGEEIPQPN